MSESTHNARLDERYRIATRLEEMAQETIAAAKARWGPGHFLLDAAIGRAKTLRDAADEIRRT